MSSKSLTKMKEIKDLFEYLTQDVKRCMIIRRKNLIKEHVIGDSKIHILNKKQILTEKYSKHPKIDEFENIYWTNRYGYVKKVLFSDGSMTYKKNNKWFESCAENYS